MSYTHTHPNTRQIRMKPPERLTEAQAAIWTRVVNSAPDYHFTPAHVDLICRYCHISAEIEVWGNWETEQLEEHGPSGLFYQTQQGVMHERPECTRLRKLKEEQTKLASNLRILPTETRREETHKARMRANRAFENGWDETEREFGVGLLFDAGDGS